MRILSAVAILAAFGPGCKASGTSSKNEITGTVTVDGEPRTVVDCRVVKGPDGNEVTFILDDKTLLTKTDRGLERRRDGKPTETIECGSSSSDGRGGSTGSAAWQSGTYEADCGATKIKLTFDCRS
jgi:hypothetical protein